MTRNQQDVYMRMRRNEENLLNVAERLGATIGVVNTDLLDQFEKLKTEMKTLTNLFLYYGEKNNPKTSNTKSPSFR